MIDMIKQWRHVFKLDPDREITDEELDLVCMSGTDAIIVGGSSGITYDNTVDLMSRVRRYELPCVFEVSDLEAVVPGFDGYLIPMVLNATDSKWMIGHHQQAIERYGYLIPWDLLIAEGYIVLNANSTVARLTGADTDLTTGAAVAYAQAAERLLNLPIVYMEYSGTFGDMELVGETHRQLERAHLIYGGGIDDSEKAAQAAQVADTVVVGNIVYSDLTKALETVLAVKGTI
ncbi:geranylgeranylglyceryl/heptaprenylglyceryl phosphate synthase [Paenibacillus xylanexedens]|uniref:heptaprenylglyceryl phosphate synthase n=1 Tax=Paenibacillus xylanexedens TaxID=528191 RepID=UPI0009385057|nr:heptaprenylglyceryl phosphate synthase [Paenibacillus xylanexedens]APO47912.1 geranylgeranylglyceryl/heptaprenylglyceryl phosphate synthase [Paenibacillus xylanexedens]